MFLELENITIGYQSPLIKNADAALSLGEVCLIIGNNGVGKTTLFRTILHQIPALSGNIRIDKKDIKTFSTKEIAKYIAMVFSKPQVPAHYTTEDLISLGKYVHYPYYFELEKKDKEDVQHIIQNLNLGPYKDWNLQKLSDGNLQKAFIGRAFAQNAPVMILDEPTTHLDEENKIIILKLLRDFAEKYNKLVLFSSHDWRLAKEFADKIWFIKDQTLHAGVAEDILISHQDLAAPFLFNMDQYFIPPVISAPLLEKEFLYSALQKNFKKDLSSFQFSYKNPFWEISTSEFVHQCHSFEEIIHFLRKRS
ncbi:ABC transporter ATP-binding protein [Chryseobacterium lacus]|uniref:ABC transporter ATP-binding protein n=1 Tax=Chryseobacterium lacus TaxID=2058346 RepID=A0A368MX17_9FLAO|nr:ABC transporter ATP-binding protein [Chryseobacterium lacus]RCU42807.1 ABC transporter ATP-binding protein [Chryseobacterium lacus]RST27372.1 ABC transporter ATP-binding protein [Chryseobacterium lacus]